MRSLIASRMHAGIAGLSSGVPTLFAGWSHKYLGLMEEIGLGEFVWEQRDAAPGSLPPLFDRMWRERAAFGSACSHTRLERGARSPGPRSSSPHAFRIARATHRTRFRRPGRRSGTDERIADRGRTPSGGPEAVLPLVSIAMPVLNESEWIETSLAAVLRQDYPPELVEILIADGQSGDGTVERIRQVMGRHPDRRIRLLPNAGRTAGAAMNLMIRQAAGELVIRVDGHTEIAPDYLRGCVHGLRGTEAESVGGCIHAAGSGFFGRAIAAATGSFWGNGGASTGAPRSACPSSWTRCRSEPGGARRSSASARSWRSGQSTRTASSTPGYGMPEARSFSIRRFAPRTSRVGHTAGAPARQYFRYGCLKWKVIARHPRQLRARQIAPPLLVLFLGASLADGVAAVAPLPLSGPLAYLAALLLASVPIALRSRLRSSMFALPVVLATLHLSYGIGLLAGAARLLGVSAIQMAGGRIPVTDEAEPPGLPTD